jgi:hypothetical protein
MKVRDLCNDPLIIEWIDTLNPSENTRKLYLQAAKLHRMHTEITQ